MRRCSVKPCEGQEAYIFISYCHKDRANVFPIIEQLARDEIRPVSRWREFGYASREAAAQDWDNLQAAHYCCNAVKGAKTQKELLGSGKKRLNLSDGSW